MKFFMICALALIAGCKPPIVTTKTINIYYTEEEIVEKYENVKIIKAKAIGDTGCDLYIVTTVQLDKVVVCPRNNSLPVLTQEISPANFGEFKLQMNLLR